MKRGLLLCFVVFYAMSRTFAQGERIVKSPDGKISLSVRVADGTLHYQVQYKGQPVIESSPIGFTIDGKEVTAHSFTRGVVDVTDSFSTQVASSDSRFATRGVHSMANDRYNRLTIPCDDGTFRLDVRVYNNGVAFRTTIVKSGSSVVNEDGTQFKLPASSIIWSQDDIHAYEGRYRKQLIDTVTAGLLVGPPLTIQLPKGLGYAAVTEAGLTNYVGIKTSFAGMSLVSLGNRVFKANLTGVVKINFDVLMPWRVIEIGPDLNTLVNCDIIASVSQKPDSSLFPKDLQTDWIKPGMSVWSWETTRRDVTLENMKAFSKMAGELKIPYNLVDEGWSKWEQGDKDKWGLLKELVDYSDSQGVKIWVWRSYPKHAGEPSLKDPVVRRAFFEKCHKTGVVGCKIDFFDSESQEVMEFYQAALKDAAELHLMLDFHGANKPTGESRTWPNEMSREAIRGMENESDWPSHNTTLPFTRYLAGHADYTPLSFIKDMTKGTTVLHQICTMGVFTSPFMCLAADPADLLKSKAGSFITTMPTVWDETVVLPQSKIGELAVYARRSGKTWYLFALNGETAKTIILPLSFLGKGNYRHLRLEDKDDDIRMMSGRAKSADSWRLDLLSGGGAAAKFEPADN